MIIKVVSTTANRGLFCCTLRVGEEKCGQTDSDHDRESEESKMITLYEREMVTQS